MPKLPPCTKHYRARARQRGLVPQVAERVLVLGRRAREGDVVHFTLAHWTIVASLDGVLITCIRHGGR